MTRRAQNFAIGRPLQFDMADALAKSVFSLDFEAPEENPFRREARPVPAK